ncbi:MAG TPA: YciI family protein [Candidatus Dormibacteraeota bacterium]|jgi:hypothetical protein|nr:YciI family protein [Candidatus Dormibacteraeota bacterium]
MRFMMLMIPNLPDDRDWMPTAGDVATMSRYNETLAQAGVLLALDGLHPPGEGVRLSFKAGKAVVTDGPFTEAKELIGGYWIIQAKSKEEAVEWASRCPVNDEHAVIEIRQIFDMSDLPADVQEAGKLSTPPSAG